MSDDRILSVEEVTKRRSMHICASSRPTGCEYDEALDCIEALHAEVARLRAERDHWKAEAIHWSSRPR